MRTSGVTRVLEYRSEIDAFKVAAIFRKRVANIENKTCEASSGGRGFECICSNYTRSPFRKEKKYVPFDLVEQSSIDGKSEVTI